MGVRRFAAATLIAFLIVGGVAACAGGSATSLSDQQRYSEGGGGSPAGAASAAPAAPQGGGAGPAVTAGPANNITKPEDAIIKTGSIRLQVTDLDAAIVATSDTMHSFGAYLSGSERSRGDGYSLGSVTYRVPAARFEDALAAVRKMGKKVVSEHTETTPVGGQIVDLQARIDNLKASEKAVQEIMAKATAINDVLAVESRLSDIQGQIEQLTAQLTSISDQATYSTLTIELEVPDPNATPTPSPAAGWSAGHELDQAVAMLTSLAQAAATVLIWIVVVVLPVGLAALLLILLALLTWRLSAPVRRLIPAPSPAPAYAPWGAQSYGAGARNVPAQPEQPPVTPDEPQS